MPENIEELVQSALAHAQEAGELPAFDVADCGITVGVAVYIISVIIDEREKNRAKTGVGKDPHEK